jgi:hypothetical protein
VTPPDEREQSLERWLEKEPYGGAAPTGACLDAETAAAWIDGGLSAAATAQAEVHVAECPRCQALVGVVVRASEQLPGPEPGSTWRRWWTWAVPIAAAATALIALSVWLNVPDARPAPSTRAADSAPAPVEGGRAESVAKVAPSSDALPIAPPEPLDRPAPGQARDALTPASPAAADQRQDFTEPTASSTQAETSAAAPASTPPSATKSNVSEAAPSATAPGVSAAADSAPAGVAAERSATPMTLSARQPIEIASPDPRLRWRVVGATVLHSSDRGATWVPTQPGVSTELSAGSAPLGAVCWLVGRASVVLLTTDGTNWTRVPFLERVDLAAVAARDARSASVTAADGRIFSTADAGATWTPR